MEIFTFLLSSMLHDCDIEKQVNDTHAHNCHVGVQMLTLQ